ncbi:MAG: type II toxin-antitoxin system YoeB family toxin [Bacteroidales bacterium]|nr:type II toxin-antitoxin system YoeB family toxin [Bacteroidales bacterium]
MEKVSQHPPKVLRRRKSSTYRKNYKNIKPEQLKGSCVEVWSRHFTKKHRLIYEIFETEIHVDVLSTYGHYGDK